MILKIHQLQQNIPTNKIYPPPTVIMVLSAAMKRELAWGVLGSASPSLLSSKHPTHGYFALCGWRLCKKKLYFNKHKGWTNPPPMVIILESAAMKSSDPCATFCSSPFSLFDAAHPTHGYFARSGYRLQRACVLWDDSVNVNMAYVLDYIDCKASRRSNGLSTLLSFCWK